MNTQIDRDKNIYGHKEIPDNIHKKLGILGLQNNDKSFYDKHEQLNKFYNATKHQKEEINRKCEEKLNSLDGLLITIDYFETIIRIFKWYYEKHANGIPDWDELKSINYSDYSIKYVFSYDKAWIK